MRPKPFTPTRILAGSESASAAARTGAARKGAARTGAAALISGKRRTRGEDGQPEGSLRRKKTSWKKEKRCSVRKKTPLDLGGVFQKVECRGGRRSFPAGWSAVKRRARRFRGFRSNGFKDERVYRAMRVRDVSVVGRLRARVPSDARLPATMHALFWHRSEKALLWTRATKKRDSRKCRATHLTDLEATRFPAITGRAVSDIMADCADIVASARSVCAVCACGSGS